MDDDPLLADVPDPSLQLFNPEREWAREVATNPDLREVLAQRARSSRKRQGDRVQQNVKAKMREFTSGATRHTDEGKLDYEGFLSPLVLQCFAEYMHENRVQADGQLRASDNWQKGIPPEAYMKSGWRHFMDWWDLHREFLDELPATEHDRNLIKKAICGVLFNAMGYLHELCKIPN